MEVQHVFSTIKGHFDIQYPMTMQEGCDKIVEHQPKGEGDKWYYDILFDKCASRQKHPPFI